MNHSHTNPQFIFCKQLLSTLTTRSHGMAGTGGLLTQRNQIHHDTIPTNQSGLHVIVMRDIEAWKHDTRRSK